MTSIRRPGSTRARRRVGRGIAGKGGKTAGRGTKGQGARDNIKPGFEGGQLPLKQRIPKLKGFKNPFRVEYVVVNLDTLEAHRGRHRHARDPAGRRPGPQARPGQGARPGRADPQGDRVGPRLLALRGGGHRRRPAAGSRSCRRRSATAGRRPRATPSPTADRRSERGFSPLDRQDPPGPGRFGGSRQEPPHDQHPLQPEEHVQGSGPPEQDHLHARDHRGLPARVAGRRCRASTSSSCQSLESASAHGGVLGFLNLFSGGALTRFAVFGLGHHALHHRRDHHPAADGGGPQVRAVAGGGGGRPEEADPDGPLPDHRPGPHAVHRPGLRVPQRRRRLPRRRQRASTST